MPVVTLMPMPYFTGTDVNGRPIANGKVRFYAAGTTTLQTVYQDALGVVPHSDPITLDGSGRAVIFFDASKSYKMVLYDASMVLVREQDYLSAVPTLNADLDLVGTFGETVAALAPVYMATDGKWYRGDSAFPAKSSQALLAGIAPAGGVINETGKVRVIGAVDGFVGLVTGSRYYIGAIGTLTSVAPANQREIGFAESPTRLILPPPRPSVGLHEMFIPAGAFVPWLGGPCGWHEDIVTTQHAYRGMPFDPTASEYAVTWLSLPKSWDRGTITGQVYWVNKVGGAGSVVWNVSAGVASDGDVYDGVTTAGGSVTDVALAANTLAITAEATAFTPAGTPTINDQIALFIQRRTGDAADNYGSDAYFLGVKLRLSTTAETDA